MARREDMPTRLSPYQQQQVFELSRKNVSIRKTAELLEVNRGTVWRLLSKQRQPVSALESTANIDEDPLSTLLTKCRGKSFEEFWSILGEPDGINGASPLYPFQRKLIEDLQKYRRVAVLAARNLGKSEIALHLGLWMT
jgi:hypothetical protein